MKALIVSIVLLAIVTAVGIWLQVSTAHVRRKDMWIPVKERLPDFGKAVLIIRDSWNDEVVVEIASCHWDKNRHCVFWSNQYNVIEHRVSAWMPLPSPYKEEL